MKSSDPKSCNPKCAAYSFRPTVFILVAWVLFMVGLMAMKSVDDHSSNPDVVWHGTVSSELDFSKARNIGYEKGVKPLTRYLIDDIRAGKLKATDKDGNQLTKEAAIILLMPKDTVHTMNEKTGALEKKVVRRDITDELFQMRLEQELHYDRKTGRVEGKIKRMAIYRDKYSRHGEYLGEDLIFWIRNAE